MKQYITKQGDTWDRVAYNVYGDEKYMDILMQNNSNLLDCFIFQAGQILNIPEIELEESDSLPDWRL